MHQTVGGRVQCSKCGYANGPSRVTCKNCGEAVPRTTARPDGPKVQGSVQDPPSPYFDRAEQLERIREMLLQGEEILAVFDMKGGGTGFLGITTKRLIVYDKAFMRKMKATVSIPFSRIHTVAAEDDSGLFTGRGFWSSSKLVVSTSHKELEFEFRGADKARGR